VPALGVGPPPSRRPPWRAHHQGVPEAPRATGRHPAPQGTDRTGGWGRAAGAAGAAGGDNAPRMVATVAAQLPASSWYRRKVSEGTKGPIEYEFARQRVTLCKSGLPDRTVWLVIKRTLGADPSYTYAISNAPASAPLRTLVWLSGLRWAVEQCFEEGKTELGMDHYEVRKYTGWQHHMLTTMLAHFFLWHLKLRLGKKSFGADGVAAPEDRRDCFASADV
jgi:hypothetical protein